MVSLSTLGVIFLLTIVRRSYGSEYFETWCGKTIDIGESGDVMYSGYDAWSHYNSYTSNLTCTVTLQTSADRQILLTWSKFNVEKLNDSIGSCADSLQIYDGVGINVTQLNLNKQCGTFGEYPNIVSTNNSLTLRLTTDAVDNSNNFKFAYTSFSTEATCDTDEFQCKNGRCIDEKLAETLDLFDNCGDGSDLEALDKWLSGIIRWGIGIFIAIIIGIVVVGILICVCCCCLCYHLICKKRPRPSNQTAVIHAPPPQAPDGMQMQGYSNNAYGQK
ncbi:enteropeptidase-like [Amphiura filiformis]|uniref:enteropeptidase-like n=1 Tax=Amphiura filiformis TaxID=82378 RepID=UPI003B222CC5